MKTEILQIVQWILDYSLVLSMQLALLLLLRPAIRRWAGAVSSYHLWLLPLVWLPFYFINWSFENMRQLLASFAENEASGDITGGLLLPASTEFGLDLSLPLLPELGISQNAEPGLWIWFSVIWLLVVLALLIKEAYRIVRFASYVEFTARRVPEDEENIIRGGTGLSVKLPLVYLKDIESPALYGLMHPVLLLPEGFLSTYDADQRHIILSHEAVHLQRGDNFWNLAACLARILFWFNPLVHIAHHYYRLDQELSCDALALARCNKSQTLHYARTLLASVARERVIRHPPIIAAWENPKQLKARINLISQHLGHARNKSSALVSLAVLSLAGGVLTSCVTGTGSPTPTAVEIADNNPDFRAPPARDSDVLSQRVYNLINEVIALRDMDDYEEALEKMAEIKALDDNGRLNLREQFVMWQFYANLYQIQENYQEAVQAYENILAISNLEQDQREQVLFYLGSLHYVQEEYLEAITRFEQYNRISDEPNAAVYFRLGSAHYQLGQYAEAIPPIQRHMEILREENEPIPKNSYDFLRSLYLSEGDLESALDILEESLDAYDNEQDRILLDELRAERTGDSQDIAQSRSPTSQISEVVSRAPRITTSDAEMLPTFSIQPDYPGEALTRKIEGWVLVGFTVNESGEVQDPAIIDAEPVNIFDESALKAASKFRFNPRVVDGRPIAVEGVRYLFRYSLD